VRGSLGARGGTEEGGGPVGQQAAETYSGVMT
jgi:hypothetical protein